MKASDYLVEYLICKGITDVFGYPGGMVTHLMDSFDKYSDRISAHIMYHEQAAAFAACGYAQASGAPGVAYATSGPGATNLITGICNAYFDSIPTIFITGQVNSSESKEEMRIRQRGFQETDIVSMVSSVTKYAVKLDDPDLLPKEIENAYHVSMTGRKGPVLLDIPMDFLRTEIDMDTLDMRKEVSIEDKTSEYDKASIARIISNALDNASLPVILIGNGVKSVSEEERIRTVLSRLKIPVVSSMIAFDVMKDDPHYYGFVGAYGHRVANFIVAKSDLVISIGSRMDIRQVGVKREGFASNASIIRFDIDSDELDYRVHEDEMQVCVDVSTVVDSMETIDADKSFDDWIGVCDEIKELLSGMDDNPPNRLIEQLSKSVPDDAIITTDVGQNQVWVAQSFRTKLHQKVLFSGGHGAMGYALPAAIGAYYGSGKRQIYCISGDGGMQMNIQELQTIIRERIPIKIIVINNNSLGMIRHFQEMYFESRFFQTKPEGGYTVPSFTRIADAYGIKTRAIKVMDSFDSNWSDEPELLEVMINDDTYVIPKLVFGKPNQDQEPLIERDMYSKIMNLTIEMID